MLVRDKLSPGWGENSLCSSRPGKHGFTAGQGWFFSRKNPGILVAARKKAEDGDLGLVWRSGGFWDVSSWEYGTSRWMRFLPGAENSREELEGFTSEPLEMDFPSGNALGCPSNCPHPAWTLGEVWDNGRCPWMSLKVPSHPNHPKVLGFPSQPAGDDRECCTAHPQKSQGNGEYSHKVLEDPQNPEVTKCP